MPKLTPRSPVYISPHALKRCQERCIGGELKHTINYLTKWLKGSAMPLYYIEKTESYYVVLPNRTILIMSTCEENEGFAVKTAYGPNEKAPKGMKKGHFRAEKIKFGGGLNA